MTAHDYEGMVQVGVIVVSSTFSTCPMSFTQCAIPVFDGLLSEPYNMHVLKLLFELAH
jgi:hypothetical protein